MMSNETEEIGLESRDKTGAKMNASCPMPKAQYSEVDSTVHMVLGYPG